MPSFRDIKCCIEVGKFDMELTEYYTNYTEREVNTFVVVPEKPTTFSIHLETEAHVWEGFIAIIWIDGVYHANKVVTGLKPPSTSSPGKAADIRFRQKTVQDGKGGRFKGSQWIFDKLRIGHADNALPLREQVKHDVGRIDVVILRSKPEGMYTLQLDGPNPVSARKKSKGRGEEATLEPVKTKSASAKAASIKAVSKKNSDKVSSLGGLFGLFDGAADHEDLDQSYAFPTQPDFDGHRSPRQHRRSHYSRRRESPSTKVTDGTDDETDSETDDDIADLEARISRLKFEKEQRHHAHKATKYSLTSNQLQDLIEGVKRNRYRYEPPLHPPPDQVLYHTQGPPGYHQQYMPLAYPQFQVPLARNPAPEDFSKHMPVTYPGPPQQWHDPNKPPAPPPSKQGQWDNQSKKSRAKVPSASGNDNMHEINKQWDGNNSGQGGGHRGGTHKAPSNKGGNGWGGTGNQQAKDKCAWDNDQCGNKNNQQKGNGGNNEQDASGGAGWDQPDHTTGWGKNDQRDNNAQAGDADWGIDNTKNNAGSAADNWGNNDNSNNNPGKNDASWDSPTGNGNGHLEWNKQDESHGWADLDPKKDKQNAEASWGNNELNIAAANNDWDKKSKKSKKSHHSTVKAPARPARIPYVPWQFSSSHYELPKQKKHHKGSIHPRLTVPEDSIAVAQARADTYVAAADEAPYYHKVKSGLQYVDSVERPFAIFRFYYRTKEAMEKLLPGVDLREKQDVGEVMKVVGRMSKAELEREVLRLKGIKPPPGSESESESDEDGSDSDDDNEEEGEEQATAGAQVPAGGADWGAEKTGRSKKSGSKAGGALDWDNGGGGGEKPGWDNGVGGGGDAGWGGADNTAGWG